MVEITYSELKSLRDDGQLTPGVLYRITDYETTTSQFKTQSAGHLFDIIVLALDNKTLSEEAFACHSERDNAMVKITITGGGGSPMTFIRAPYGDGEYGGEHYYAFVENQDLFPIYVKSLEETPTTSTIFVFTDDGGHCSITQDPTAVTTFNTVDETAEVVNIEYGYFSGSNLSAWKLWYCLDNDTSRFHWAKPSDGEKRVNPNFKGPIGRRDEEHNMSEYGLCAWRFVDRETYYLYTFNDNPKIGDHFIASVAPAGIVVSASSESITLEGGFTYTRNSSYDCEGHFGWKVTEATGTDLIYTDTENPTTTSTIYGASSSQYIADISWNGKGIIYRMIDEWGNDCPYDFKNIQYILPIIESGEYSGLVDTTGSSSYYLPLNTFGWHGEDATLLGGSSGATLNIIGSRYEEGVYMLPVVHLGYAKGTQIGVNCSNVFLGNMKGGIVCPYCTDINYQSGDRVDYHNYEWFGRARNGSVVQTNLFGTAT